MRHLAPVLLVACMAQAGAQAPPAATPDGATLFTRQCAACHSIVAGQPHRQGPNLRGVIGRPAGRVDGFRYSAALQAADFVWDSARLDGYLTNPQSVVPGGTMAYTQRNAEVRSVIIAWLREQN